MQTTLERPGRADRSTDDRRLRRLDTELAALDRLTHEAMRRRREVQPDTEDYRQTDERVYDLTSLATELRLQLDRNGRRFGP